MKTPLKISLVLVGFFLLTCCATTGPKFAELAPTISNLSPESGRIYVYRTSALGAAVQPAVKLNGEVIGKAVPKGFFYIDRKPGDYEIITKTEVTRRLSLTLDEGQIRYVRLNISMGFFVGHVYPELVEPQVGEKEIQGCRYISEKTQTVAKEMPKVVEPSEKTKPATTRAGNEEEAVKATVQEFVKLYNSEDTKAIISLYHPNAKIKTGMGSNQRIVSREEYADIVPTRVKQVGTLTLKDIDEVEIKGNKAKVEAITVINKSGRKLRVTFSLVSEEGKWLIMVQDY